MKKCYTLCAVIVLSLSLASCDDEKEKLKGNAILRFEVEGRLATIGFSELTIDILETVDIANVKPIIEISEGATISPASGVAQDFSNPVTYTVTSESGVSKSFVVTARILAGLSRFAVLQGIQVYYSLFDHENRTIVVAPDFDIMRELQRNNVPAFIDFDLQDGFSASLADNSIFDLNDPGEITISKGSQSFSYSIAVKNSSNRLHYVALEDVPFIGTTIPEVSYPEHSQGLGPFSFIIRQLSNVDLSNVIIKRFAYAENATVTPDPTNPVNLESDLKFTITSETGSSQVYTVRVTKEDFLMYRDTPFATLGIPADGREFSVGYKSVSPIIAASLRNVADNSIIECTFRSQSYSSSSILYLDPINPFPLGNYNLHVILANGKSFQPGRTLIAY